jgi:hypothetical protein
MQHGPVFGPVNLVAPEHGVDPLPQPGFLRKLEEELDRLARDAILRVIEVNARRFGRQTLAALRVIREQISQMQPAGLFTMNFEVLPGGPLLETSIREWFYYCCHIWIPFVWW